MENDLELDALEKELREKKLPANPFVEQPNDVPQVPPQVDTRTQFAKKMDDVKEDILKVAATEDQKFVKDVKDNVKGAAVSYTQAEKAKADLEKQQVSYQSEKLETAQLQNQNQQKEDAWSNKVKRREFAYHGVKPIMLFVGITEPMNIALLVFLTIVLLPFYLISKLFRGTVGALIAGAEDEDRPKLVRGFIWTVIGIVFVGVVGACVYLFLKWQGII